MGDKHGLVFFHVAGFQSLCPQPVIPPGIVVTQWQDPGLGPVESIEHGALQDQLRRFDYPGNRGGQDTQHLFYQSSSVPVTAPICRR